MSRGLAGLVVLLAAFLFAALSVVGSAQEKPAGEGEKPGGGKETGIPAPAALKNDPVAEELFRKAVAWQGKPTEPLNADKVSTLQIDELLFKSYGTNELEGSFQILYTQPEKILFKVRTPSWWRAYRSDGESSWWKTGAMSGGWAKLATGNKDDAEKIDQIKAALRIVRLLFLQNFLDGNTVFQSFGEQVLTKAGKEYPPADLIKCMRKGEDSVLFYLGKQGGAPVCIVVHQFLNMYHPDRDFFIYLEDCKRFNGIMLPTKIKIYIRHLSTGFDEKFLFCQLVDDQSSKVRVNQPIPSKAYKGD